MCQILRGKDCFFHRNTPVNVKGRVQDVYPAIGLRSIKRIALILAYGHIAEDAKAVRKAFRDKYLPMILFRQFHRHVLPVGRTPLPDIHSYIQNTAFYTAEQFAL